MCTVKFIQEKKLKQTAEVNYNTDLPQKYFKEITIDCSQNAASSSFH